ncbi:MAG: cobalamin biosynthesis protein CobD [Aphanocapsa feldmannii 277cV]|uniref:Cobalamin biosynthesis protein CobD n=2 Tax=Aphanocapsa feldmannii TaxID=192050 RepID=A0A524RNN2_9CHRO|nr:MAG: cobalamin biosynthesis protein CobD [Aphanocapsa feldmannii 277cV]
MARQIGMAACPPLLWCLVATASLLDRLIGDPLSCFHPVQALGWLISRCRALLEPPCRGHPAGLSLAGLAITLLVSAGAVLAGHALERLTLLWPAVGLPLLLAGLASCLAGRSLRDAVEAVLALLRCDALEAARCQLARVVGRDVNQLDRSEILRALAETASENAIDGAFAPLFWMLLGAALWGLGFPLGPLALGWGFKAASTLDSMLGYRQGNLRWLGTSAARLDDVLVWLPCRLAALTVALLSKQPTLACMARATREARSDPSPNAGLSEAIYANALGMALGGTNRYGTQLVHKPLLGQGHPPPGEADVLACLRMTRAGLTSWLLISLAIVLTVCLG